jgi:hypothetical protein
MSKVILATVTAARGIAVAPANPAHEVAGTSPSPDDNGKITAETGFGSKEQALASVNVPSRR